MWRAVTSWWVVDDRSTGLLRNGVTKQATVVAVHGGVFRSRVTVEFHTPDGTIIHTTVAVRNPLPVGTVVYVSYDPSAATSLIIEDDYANTSQDWVVAVFLVGLGLFLAAPVSAVRTHRRKNRAARTLPLPSVTALESAKGLRKRAKPWTGHGPGPWSQLAFPRQLPDAWEAFDTAIGARYRWVRGKGVQMTWVRTQVRVGSLVDGDGDVVANLIRRKGVTLVTIDGVAVYEISKGYVLTEVASGDLVLAMCGAHIHQRAGTEFRFPERRTLWFPVTAGSERDVGISDSGRRPAGVMFGVDERGRQVCMARTPAGGGSLPQIDVVVCGDRTRQGLVVALLAAPLLTAYFTTPRGG
jgi:hypothetical protein